jgi:ATP-dependent Lhr-like helicase
VEKGFVKFEKIETKLPSPFAFNLVLQGYTDIMKMEDKIEFMKRMHREILREIGEEFPVPKKSEISQVKEIGE